MYQTLIKPLFADVKTFVLDTLFPKTCVACGMEGEFLCLYCKSTLQPVEFQKCIICRKPSLYGLTHPGCKTPYGPEGLISFFDYHDQKVSDSIIQGKYSFLDGVYEILGTQVANKLKTSYPQLTTNYSLIPIPLSPSRKRWRGFNQAEVLCNTIGVQLNMRVINVLQRIKSTKTQKDLKREARIENMSGAFAVSPLFSKEGVRGSSFILIDDVTTTGSTLLEAVKVLKRNGAAEVWCLTVARD